MSKKLFERFFAVGTPERRSSVWRIWASKKGDVYLTSAEVSSDFKLSLHPSGRCHLSYRDIGSREAAQSGDHPTVVVDALPPALAAASSDGAGRFDDVWHIRDIVPGLAVPFRLCMPESELRSLPRATLHDREVSWLPAPNEGAAIEVSLMVIGDSVPPDVIPGSESAGNRLLLRQSLGNARTLLIAWREYRPSAEERMWTVAYRPNVTPVGEHLVREAHLFNYHRAVVEIRDDANFARAMLEVAID